MSAFLAERGRDPLKASSDDARAFLAHRGAAGLKASSLARQLSSVRQFHKHLYLEGRRADDPTMAIEGPRRSRPIPKVLGVAEVDRLLAVAREGLDVEGRPAGERLRALRLSCLVELLYGSGLRVSELLGLPKSAARAREPLDRACAARAARSGWFRFPSRRARRSRAIARCWKSARPAPPRARGCFPPTATAAISPARLSRAN